MNFENAFKADMPFDIMYQPSRKEASRKKPVFFIHKYFAIVNDIFIYLL